MKFRTTTLSFPSKPSPCMRPPGISPLRGVLLAISLLALSGCSTVYDNTVGLVWSDTPQSDTVSPGNTGETTDEMGLANVDGTNADGATAGTTTAALANTSERVRESHSAPTSIPVEGEEEVATDEVEVLWKIPEETVEGFVLQYGFQENDLPNEVVLELSEIEKYDDPEFGFVYRYVLKNIPPSERIFVRLATRSDGKQTPFSEAFEVAPEEG
ncbi:hypothetical protein MRY87_04140 [bacterium]|nr:hypothetical protein [bacterium]